MAARDQARRLPRHRPQGQRPCAALQPPWQQPDRALSAYRRGLAPPALALLFIDGEAVCCDDKGVPSFNRIRYRHHDRSVFFYAFDLIELNGDDLRREPLEVRKVTLASVLTKAAPGVRLNEHIEADGPTVFAHACKMGLEGIVSKHKGSRYISGRSTDCLKSKNPASEAVRGEVVWWASPNDLGYITANCIFFRVRNIAADCAEVEWVSYQT
jgi:hypothetical protein